VPSLDCGIQAYVLENLAGTTGLEPPSRGSRSNTLLIHGLPIALLLKFADLIQWHQGIPDLVNAAADIRVYESELALRFRHHTS
jgi:hypothetical protein